MVMASDIEAAIASLDVQLDALAPGLRERIPVSRYVKDVRTHPQLRTHAYFSRRRLALLNTARDEHGAAALACYNKLMLAACMMNSLDGLRPGAYPESIVAEFHAWFGRVLADFARQPDDYYDPAQRDFVYDTGVCCLRSLPVGGAWFVQVRWTGWRSLQTLNVVRLARVMGCFVLRTRGFTPFCVIHTFPRYLPRFDCRRMDTAYRRIGELMERDPRIRGVYRRSWFLDPKVSEISPHMAYLREVPQRNGAVLFPAGTIEEDVASATANSPQRRKLYEEGDYAPTAYAYLWPRADFLRWLGESQP